jgi:predicted nucleic acid-binding protein
MVIGLIEGDDQQQQTLKSRLLSKHIVSSELVRLETRLLPIRQQNTLSLQSFNRFFTLCEIIDLNRAVFERATTLRAEQNLKTPDALHLAAAIEAKCDEFWTNDKHLVKAAGEHLRVLNWEGLTA